MPPRPLFPLFAALLAVSVAAPPAPADSPYATEVVSASFETNRKLNSWRHPSAVLGPPARMVPASSYSGAGPVSPANPASATNDIVSLVNTYDDDGNEIPASITVRFDHPVLDDPATPYGLDFLVFGNALQVVTGYVYPDTDPAGTVFRTDSLIAEPGLVEVSADGVTWFAYTDGPYADDWAPTLGFVYDPDHADPALFPGNLWWGAPADPTRPPDPTLSPRSFKGLSLDRVAQLYEGSAGGTGFDISRFDLPRDAQGRKWIQYVRVTSRTTAETDAAWTEIDAFADVAPAPAYDNWRRAHFSLADRLAGAGADRLAVAPNGRTCLENAFLGLAPDASDGPAFRIAGASFAKDAVTFALPGSDSAADMLRIGVAHSLADDPADDLRVPTPLGRDASGNALYSLPLDPDAPSAFFRLYLR